MTRQSEPHPLRIYLAGSWKNAEAILTLQRLLAAIGYDVDCFASTDTGRTSFNWTELTHTLGCTTQEQAEEKLKQMDAIDLLKFNRVIEAFKEDKKWLDWCDACILVLPSGKSAHLEAGYAKGQGKLLIIFGEFLKGERDVMYGFADATFRENEITQLTEYLTGCASHSAAGERIAEVIADLEQRISNANAVGAYPMIGVYEVIRLLKEGVRK